MKLIAFTVRNYRSILEAYKLALENYTVFVGPNNEGKSNILKGIVLSLNVITRGRAYTGPRRGPVRYYRAASSFDYDWTRDFPVSLQSTWPNGKSEFTLEFQLTENDFHLFKQKVGVNLATNLNIRLHFGHEDADFEVLMKGRGKKTLNNRRKEIADFIREHITAQYISAIRPSEMASDIISGIVERELEPLEQDSDYRSILGQLQAKQQPILDNISSKVKATIKDFVAGVNDIAIEPYKGLSRAIRSDFRVLIDDGARTELSLKGDGVISLATIALIKYVSQESLASKSLILSIEEPESHLHSRSVHGLRRVLKDISQQHQVIITTHSPILVEREILKQNILVQSGYARRAKKIEDIREALGIQLSDNLLGAYLVLLVEGEEDRDILTCWIQALSPAIRDAIEHRILVLDHLAGASNVGYKATFYRQNVCNIHIYLDNDDNGRNAVGDAIGRGIIENTDYNLASCRDMRDSEIEDLINLESYREGVLSKYGVDLQNPLFRRADSKWSERTKAVFEAAGKLWNKQIKMQVKRTIADAAVAAGELSLNVHRKASIDSLIQGLEGKLIKRNE